MLHQTSTRARRIVGSLGRGEQLVEVLSGLCEDEQVEAGELRALGTLGEVALTRFEPESRKEVVVFEGQGLFEIAHFAGNVTTLGGVKALRIDVMLSVQGPLGPQLIAGQLRSAKVVALEFVLDVFEDLRIERSLDTETGRLRFSALHLLELAEPEPAAPTTPARKPEPKPDPKPAPPARKPEPEPEPEPVRVAAAPASEANGTSQPAPTKQRVAQTAMSWDDAIERANTDAAPAAPERPSRPRPESAQAAHDNSSIYDELDDDYFEGTMLKPGDLLDHPKLGRCRVMKVDEDDDYAHIRLPRGQIRKLKLEICEFVPKGNEDGRDVYQVRIRR